MASQFFKKTMQKPLPLFVAASKSEEKYSSRKNPAKWPTCMIASRDYCHAPLGVSSFSFSIQNVWEMTTVVDKIACRSCTACPPPTVLRLFIADTIGFTTVYS